MDLYVFRHGIAYELHEWEGSDDSRPLTSEGKDRVEEVVSLLKKKHGLSLDTIWSSPLVRAMQTALIAAEIVKLPVKVVDELACGSTVEKLEQALHRLGTPARLMIVGHEPDCGEVIGDLLGDSNGGYALKKSGIAHLKGKFAPGGMKLAWKYAPKDLIDG